LAIRDFIRWIKHGTIAEYRKRKAEYIANGVPEIEAAHRSADEAVNELKHRTRQRRRVERDQLLGLVGHEELLRRYRGNARLTDAHSRRVARRMLQVNRWAVVERAMRECGYPEAEIKETIASLTDEFKKRETAGQAKWVQIRKAILRRQAEADAFAKAQEVQAQMVKKLPSVRASRYVKKWADRSASQGQDCNPRLR